MDWDKVVNTVGNFAKRTLIMAGSAVVVMAAIGGTYVAGLAIWWMVRQAQAALGG